MNHFRWINYPIGLDTELRLQYEALADELITNATEPIAIVWANANEDWVDDNGVDPERDCLLVTKHSEQIDGEYGFGVNISSHKIELTNGERSLMSRSYV